MKCKAQGRNPKARRSRDLQSARPDSDDTRCRRLRHSYMRSDTRIVYDAGTMHERVGVLVSDDVEVVGHYYKTIMKFIHPDKVSEGQKGVASDVSQMIGEAATRSIYDPQEASTTLKDPELRKRYSL